MRICPKMAINEKFKKGQRIGFVNPDTGQVEYGTIMYKSQDHEGCWYLKSDKKIVWWVKEYLLKIIN